MATRKFQNDFVVVEEGENWHHHIKKSQEGVSGMLNSFESELAFILLDYGEGLPNISFDLVE